MLPLGRRLLSGCLANPLARSFSCRGLPYRAASAHTLRCYATSEPPLPVVKKQRPNKTAAKREAQQVQQIATALCKLSDRQLERLSPLLGSRALDAIAEARGIPNRSKAKGRQEAFVAKLLRDDLEEEGQQKMLEEAVASVSIGQGVVVNPEVEHLAQLWMEGLLAQDKDVMTVVYGLPSDGLVDSQQLRQLVRQIQQWRQAETGDQASEGSSAALATSKGRQKGQIQKAEVKLRQALARLAHGVVAAEREAADVLE
ncbi:hypothetical protein N2152v2_007495 [Parachlorella kessleri]